MVFRNWEKEKQDKKKQEVTPDKLSRLKLLISYFRAEYDKFSKQDKLSRLNLLINYFRVGYGKFSKPLGSYWRLAYISFAGVSIVCILVPLFSFMANITNFDIYKLISLILGIAVVVIALYFNLKVLRNVIYGKHSYEKNLRNWCEIFGINFDKLVDINSPSGYIEFKKDTIEQNGSNNENESSQKD